MDPKNNWAYQDYELKETSKLSQEEWTNHSIELKIDNKDLWGTVYKLDLKVMQLVMIIPVFIMTMSH